MKNRKVPGDKPFIKMMTAINATPQKVSLNLLFDVDSVKIEYEGEKNKVLSLTIHCALKEISDDLELESFFNHINSKDDNAPSYQDVQNAFDLVSNYFAVRSLAIKPEPESNQN